MTKTCPDCDATVLSTSQPVGDYVLMPREATRAMTMAGCDMLPSCEHVFGHAGEILRNAYRKMVEVAALAATPAVGGEDWKDDPSADERWQAGCDFALIELCGALGVNPKMVRWDAATETLDGDVNAVIWNILHAKMGEDWDPDAAQPASPLRGITDEMVERAWAAIVGNDIAKTCFNASIIRADLKTALIAVSASPPEQPAAAPVTGREALDRAAFQLFLLDNNASRWPSVNQDQYRREAKSILDAAFPATPPNKET